MSPTMSVLFFHDCRVIMTVSCHVAVFMFVQPRWR